MNRLLASCAIAALILYALPLRAAEPIGGKAMLPSASNATLPNARDNLSVAATVPTHAALVAATIAKYPNGVWRADYAVGNGVPALFFLPQTGTCVSHGMTDDIGHCVNNGEGNSFVAQYSGNIVDPQQFDPLCGGQTTPDEFLAQTAHDCGPAISAAIAVSINGTRAAVKLKKGYYYIKSSATLKSQTLSGAGRGQTFILVDNKFDPNSSGIILTDDLSYPQSNNTHASEIQDLSIVFMQPDDQGSRSNFLTLSDGCSSIPGGTGCQYPFAIYTRNARVAINDVQIIGAWNGVYYHGDAPRIRGLDMAALNTGLDLGEIHDFGYVNDFEFHNAFLCYFNSGSCNLHNVYYDGNTFAAKIGAVDGTTFNNWRVFRGRVSLTSDFTFGTFNSLELDTDNATLEVAHTSSGGAGLIINGGYVAGAATGADTACQIDIGPDANQVSISNFVMIVGSPGPGGLCVKGGKVNYSGGTIGGNGVTSVNLSGGTTSIVGTQFISSDIVYGGAQINVHDSACVQITGTNQKTAATHGQEWISLGTDTSCNYISGNFLNGWSLASFGPAKVFGYYDFGDYAFPLTITPKFATNGDFAPTQGSNEQVGVYYRHGNYIDVEFNWGFDVNAFTTASGGFLLEFTNAPEELLSPNNQGMCVLGEIDNITLTGGQGVNCHVTNFGSKAVLSPGMVRGASTNKQFDELNVVSGTSAVRFRGSARYRMH